MQSKTSLFNTAIIRDDLRRTAPAWGGLTGFWLLMLTLPVIISHNQYVQNIYAVDGFDLRIARELCNYITTAVPIVAFCYGPLIAMMIFHTMYTTRGAVGTHALPVTRTQLFFNHWISALLCVAVPTALVCLITAPFLLLWNAGNMENLAMLFFTMVGCFIWDFSFAAFCAMFTGQIFWLPVFYGIMALLPYAVAAAWVWLCDSLLWGFYESSVTVDVFQILSPGMYLILGGISGTYTADVAYINPGSMAHVAVCAAAGLALAVVTWVLYRLRHMETAGEIVTYPVMRVVFRIGVAVCSGMVSMAVLQEMANTYSGFGMFLSSIPGVCIGLICAQMLVKKSFRVFNKRLAMEGTCVIIALGTMVGVMATGGLGFEKRVPAAEKVDYVALDVYGCDGPVRIGGRIKITDPEQICTMTELHSLYVAGGKEQEYSSMVRRNENYLYYGRDFTSPQFRFEYHMQNGKVIGRSYEPGITREMLEDPASFASRYQAFLQKLDYTESLKATRDKAEVSAYNYFYNVDGTVVPDYINRERSLSAGHPAALAVMDALIAELEAMDELPVSFLYDENEKVGETWNISLWHDPEWKGDNGYIMDVCFLSDRMPRTSYALENAPETTYAIDERVDRFVTSIN